MTVSTRRSGERRGTPVAVGSIWYILFQPSIGPVNYLLSFVGLGPYNLLGSASTALWAIVIADTWQWTPFIYLLVLSALQGIPETVIEAAKQRLEHYQTTRFECHENNEAIRYLKAALDILDQRTKDREARGVEGTHEV